MPNLAPFEAAYGGREALIEHTRQALALPPEVQKALDILENPESANLSFHTVLKRTGCSIAAFYAAMRDATIALGHAKTMQAMMERLPEVAVDMAAAAISKDEPCICTVSTRGPIPANAECKECHGRGIVRYRPDAERHRLVMEAAGVLKKGPGVSVTNTTQIAAPTYTTGAFDRLVKSTDAALEKHLLMPSSPKAQSEVADVEVLDGDA